MKAAFSSPDYVRPCLRHMFADDQNDATRRKHGLVGGETDVVVGRVGRDVPINVAVDLLVCHSTHGPRAATQRLCDDLPLCTHKQHSDVSHVNEEVTHI